MSMGERRDGAHHPRRPTSVEPDRSAGRCRDKIPFERLSDNTVFAKTAVLGGEREANAKLGKPVEVVEVGVGSTAIEQRGCGAPCVECLCQGEERRKADASGDHPCLSRWGDDGEGSSQRPQALQVLSRFHGEEYACYGADRLVQERQAGDLSVGASEYFEDRKGAAEQRFCPEAAFDHDELARLTLSRDLGGCDRDDVVVWGKPIVRQYHGVDIDRHPGEYT